MDPCYVLMDPVLFMILEVSRHVSKVELSPLVIGNFKTGFQAVFRNPPSFMPKDLIGEVRSNFSSSDSVREDDLKPVAIEPTAFAS